MNHVSWTSLNNRNKHIIIKQIYYTHDSTSAELLIKILLDDYKKDIYHVNNIFINLLCITLAKTHDIKYLSFIINAKDSSGDLFFHIDSNLLYEFSPKNVRNTCVTDILKFIANNDDYYLQYLTEYELELYKNWIKKYSKQYNEKLVITQWNKYSSDEFKGYINDIIDDYGLTC